MTDVVFAFGTDGYFFESQTQWRMYVDTHMRKFSLTPDRKDLPHRLISRFSSGSSDVAHVHHLVLGAGESWFMSYRTKAGGASFAHDGLPEKLAAWLRLKDANGYSVRNIAKLQISLGPYNASFWAEDGKDYFWDNLPGPLQLALEKLKSPQGGWSRAPKIVALGVFQSYVLISEGGGGSYAVSDYYPWLEKELVALIQSGKPGALKKIHYISLDQHDGQNFVMTTVDGNVYYYVPDSLSTDLAAIRTTIPKVPAGYLAGREAETGSNPMPTPQSVSVPSAGPDLYRSPEEIHAQNPALSANYSNPDTPGIGSHVQHLPSVSPVEYTQAPAPPYTPNPNLSNGHRSSISNSNSVPVSHVHGHAQSDQVANVQREGSAQSLYQHPQVTALENAAANTRIASPVPSMSQSQYSHEILQHNATGMLQRIMAPVPVTEQPMTISRTPDVVSPSHSNQNQADSPAVVAIGQVSDQTTSSNPPSGRVSAARVSGSNSPITRTSASPVHGSQSQFQQRAAHNEAYQMTGGTSPMQEVAPSQGNAMGPVSASGLQNGGQGIRADQFHTQVSHMTLQPGDSSPALVQHTPQSQQSSPPPVPNPTPVAYNVQFAGSSAISLSSVNAPVPVLHSPGATPSRADSVPIPTISTPAPQSPGPQTQQQLVSVPVKPVSHAQSFLQGSSTLSGIPNVQVLAEVSASPPPPRQSFAASGDAGSLNGSLPYQNTASSEQPSGLPGAVPFMPPTTGTPPIQLSTPVGSPAPVQPQQIHISPGPSSFQRVTSPSLEPQLVQVASVPSHNLASVPGQPQLIRVVSSPGPVQYVAAPSGMQLVSGTQLVHAQSLIPLSSPQIHQGQSVQAASPSAAGASSSSNQMNQKTNSAEQKKKQQQEGQGRKLATALGIGLAKGAVRAIISS